jgi:hypothetical protein
VTLPPIEVEVPIVLLYVLVVPRERRVSK